MTNLGWLRSKAAAVTSNAIALALVYDDDPELQGLSQPAKNELFGVPPRVHVRSGTRPGPRVREHRGGVRGH
jgi:hypothetical protein